MEADFMARQVLLVVSLFCMVAGCSRQNEQVKWYNAASINLQNRADVIYYNREPFTGTVYLLASNGKDTAAVSGFLDGKEQGSWRKYYSCGKLAEQRFYDHGRKTGTLTEWWENGVKKLEYHFENNEYEGNCREWNSKGMLVSDMHYHKGYEMGMQRTFYDNGKVKASYLMKEGRRFGLLGTKNCVNVSDSIFRKL